MAATLSYEALLSGQNVPGMEGIRIFDGNRDPWGYDESANYLKHTLCQIEVDRLQAIGNRIDREGEIKKDSIIDPWKPLRELTSNLLPHMAFIRIDATNRDQVRVLFRVHRLDVLVDLDDLSSGEKSIVQMFYPLIEREIKALIKDIELVAPPPARPELCVLIDEPELHLHPNLQLKVLDYLRVITSKQPVQVIVATHSPTVAEAASFEELFLLRPTELVGSDENQLVRVASDEDRLATLRSLFGSVHNLTSMLPVIVVESVSTEQGRAVPDRQLYRALHPAFDRATLIAGGGKRECISLRRALEPALAEFAPALRVIALLDKDCAPLVEKGVELLSVSMIENFLLDPDVIYEAIESVRTRTPFKTVDDVPAALDAILTEARDFEVGRRTAAALGPAFFHPPSQIAEIGAKIAAFQLSLEQRYSEAAVAAAAAAANTAVDVICAANRRREEFDGKRVLSTFFGRHLNDSTLSRPVFAFYAARRARRRKAVVAYFNQLLERLTTPSPATPAA
ncbi:MAG: AAA family ATPase [Nitrospirales bacterium]